MYKLAFSSSISKYSCLALFYPLASLFPPLSFASTHFPSPVLFSVGSFPSSLSCFLSFCFVLGPAPVIHGLSLRFPLLWFSSQLLSPAVSLPLSTVVVSYKSADVNHHVPALCSIGYAHEATKSLSINAWIWYTRADSLNRNTHYFTPSFFPPL